MAQRRRIQLADLLIPIATFSVIVVGIVWIFLIIDMVKQFTN
jgi:hypothetical protein